MIPVISRTTTKFPREGLLLPRNVKVCSMFSMDRLPYRQKFLNDRNSKIFYHSLKDHPKVSKIAKFRCEML